MSEKPTERPQEDHPRPTRNAHLDPDTWVERHGDVLFGYALLRVRDPALAEDLVQESLLAALEAQSRFSGQSTERTWLVGILKHKIIDHIRKKSREAALREIEPGTDSSQVFFGRLGSWKRRPDEWAVDPGRAHDRQEFRKVLSDCLSNMPSRLADAFMLREMEELDCKEICKVLSVSPTNIWVMLHRARLRLRQCLEQNWFGSTEKED